MNPELLDFIARADTRQHYYEVLFPALVGLTRHELERVIEVMIDHLNQIDGDIDLEANGDELDTSNAEDEFFVRELLG